MWIEFWRSVAITVVVLYGSGYLFFRGMRFSQLAAICCAPLYSVLMCGVVPIAYERLGIACTIPTMLLPMLGLSTLVFAIGGRQLGRKAFLGAVPEPPVALRWSRFNGTVPFDLAIPILYMCVASLVCAFVFICNLPDASAFYARFDNQTHINVVRSFADSGSWSSFNHSFYLASPQYANPLGSTASSFYPCAWHDLNALVCLCAGSSVPVAANAVVVVLASVVFPLGMFFLLRMLPLVSRRAVLLGAISASGFSTWPWTFLIKGPCLPNILGLCLMVLFLGGVAGFIAQNLVRSLVVPFCVFCGTSLVSLFLAHPNTLFTAYVFLAPYGAHVVWQATLAKESASKRTRIQSLLLVGTYAALVAGFWVWCYGLPQFQGILSKDWWNKHYSLSLVLRWLATLGLAITTEQIVMALAFVVGMCHSARHKCWWPIFPVAFFSLCFVASQLGWWSIKYWLGGMWYMTAYRFAANLSIFAMPLAAVGLDRLLNTFLRLYQALCNAKPREGREARTQWVAVLFVVLVVFANYWPQLPFSYGGETIELSYGRVSSHLHSIYAKNVDHVYNAEEIAFVNKCMSVIPSGALVVNSPNDGSVWAYGANGMNTLYRYYDIKNDTDASQMIRTRLNEYSTNSAVRNAVRNMDAQYVLLLDAGVAHKDGLWIPYYSKKKSAKWKGIDAINDATPGFTVCLAEGSQMRLYKIER